MLIHILTDSDGAWGRSGIGWRNCVEASGRWRRCFAMKRSFFRAIAKRLQHLSEAFTQFLHSTPFWLIVVQYPPPFALVCFPGHWGKRFLRWRNRDHIPRRRAFKAIWNVMSTYCPMLVFRGPILKCFCPSCPTNCNAHFVKRWHPV